VINHTAAQLALRSRLLTVAGLPAARAWENKNYTAIPGTPYVADSYVPGTNSLITFPANNGTVEETGLYVVQWYGVADSGIGTIRAGVQAILAAFAPGTVVTSTTGDVIRVRTDVGPMAGQLMPMDAGFAVCTVKIPWRARSQNAIAP
jgi:hypothetical protein